MKLVITTRSVFTHSVNQSIPLPTQIIATYPWYLPALADKTLILASEGEWEQALDTAQRLLDVEGDNLDALKVSFRFLASLVCLLDSLLIHCPLSL